MRLPMVFISTRRHRAFHFLLSMNQGQYIHIDAYNLVLSPPYLSELWTAAKTPISSPLLLYLALPLSFRQERSGRHHCCYAVVCGSRFSSVSRSIYQPSKPATQSGNWGTRHWRMDWDVLAKGHRWENPLMGWQSSGDFMQGTKLEFKTKEDAIHFAEKQGYEYFVQEPNERAFAPKAYANNFLYSPKKLKHVRTK
jgi:hypothetical protein